MTTDTRNTFLKCTRLSLSALVISNKTCIQGFSDFVFDSAGPWSIKRLICSALNVMKTSALLFKNKLF